MPLRRRRRQSGRETAEPLRAERDLRQQHQHLPAGGERRGDRGEIGLGLARAGDAVEHGDAKPARLDPVDEAARRERLVGRQQRAGATPIGPRRRGAARLRPGAPRRSPPATRSRTTPAPQPASRATSAAGSGGPSRKSFEHPPARRGQVARFGVGVRRARQARPARSRRGVAAAAAAAPRRRSSPCAAPRPAAPSCRRRHARRSGAARARAAATAGSRRSASAARAAASPPRPSHTTPTRLRPPSGTRTKLPGSGVGIVLGDAIVERLRQRQRQQHADARGGRGARRRRGGFTGAASRGWQPRNWHGARASAKLAPHASERQALQRPRPRRVRRAISGLGSGGLSDDPVCLPLAIVIGRPRRGAATWS